MYKNALKQYRLGAIVYGLQMLGMAFILHGQLLIRHSDVFGILIFEVIASVAIVCDAWLTTYSIERTVRLKKIFCGTDRAPDELLSDCDLKVSSSLFVYPDHIITLFEPAQIPYGDIKKITFKEGFSIRLAYLCRVRIYDKNGGKHTAGLFTENENEVNGLKDDIETLIYVLQRIEPDITIVDKRKKNSVYL